MLLTPDGWISGIMLDVTELTNLTHELIWLGREPNSGMLVKACSRSHSRSSEYVRHQGRR